MSGIFARRRSRLLAMKALRERYVPPEDAVSCPRCGQDSSHQAVSRNLYLCPHCGHHFPVGAYYRLGITLDQGSFRELYPKMTAQDPLSFPGYREKLADARQKTGLSGRLFPPWGPSMAAAAWRACWTAGSCWGP